MPIQKFEEATVDGAEGMDAHPFEPIFRTRFIATGEDSLDNVSVHAHAHIPGTLAVTGFGTLYRQPLQFTRKGFEVYEVEAMYGRRNWTILEVHIRGSTMGGGTFRMIQGLETIATSAGAPDYKSMIGVNKIDRTVEGVEEELPALDYSIDITYPVGFLTNAMMAAWSELSKKVNSVPWCGWGAGTVYYRGAEFDGVPLGANQTPLHVTHQVSVSRNLVNATIAGFSGINKEGWDVLWWLHEEVDVGNVTVRNPLHWYVVRTKLRANFASVLGFG